MSRDPIPLAAHEERRVVVEGWGVKRREMGPDDLRLMKSGASSSRGRSHDRSELAVFEEVGGRFICRMLRGYDCRMLRGYDRVPFAEQEADLLRMLNTLPVARLSIDKSGIGMNLAENLSRCYQQVVPESFTNESKERWATDFKILLQRRGHADRFWAIVLACLRERGPSRRAEAEVGVRVIG